MKSAILIGTTMLASTSVLADPVAEKRNLGNTPFKHGGNLITDASMDGTICNFMSTSEIFANHFDAGFVDKSGTIEQNFVAGTGKYNYIGSTNAAAWDSNDAIHLGTFTVSFVLDNKIAADGNYKFFKFNSAANPNPKWEDESAYTANGAEAKQDLVTLCFYKNSLPADCNGATYTQEVTVDLPDTGETKYDSTTPTTISLRKIIGVASKCGVGDAGYDLTGGAEDIFAWADIKDSHQLDYGITVTNLDTANDGSTYPSDGSGVHDLAGSDDGHNSGAVSYTLTLNHNHDVHDLLFIDGDVSAIAQAANSAGTFDTVADGQVDLNYGVGYSVAGEVVRDAASQSKTCNSVLTVDAMGLETGGTAMAVGQDAVWHCFRTGDRTNLFPTSGASDGDSSTGALDTLNNGTNVQQHDSCTAKLTTTCDLANFAITGTDGRTCTPDVNGGVTTQEVDGSPGAVLTELDCLDSPFWMRNFEYEAFVPVSIVQEAAIIQAIRLRDERAYPKDAKGEHGTAKTVTSLLGTLVAQTTDWVCDDSDCSEDPYKVLGVETKTSFVYCPSSGNLVGIQNQNQVSKSSFTQACTATVENIGIEVGIETPPADYPETYVFGAVSYKVTTQTTSGPKITEKDGEPGASQVTTPIDGDETIKTIGSTDEVTTTSDTLDNARRLISAKATDTSVTYFQVTDAVQHGLNF